MQYAIVGTNKHQKPTQGVKGICPVCGEQLVAKCGKIRIHHWAHSAKSECKYKENKGEWHVNWQNKFPEDWQEVLMINQENNEKNLADIRTPSGFVLEFQHSHIKIDELQAREDFYKDMAWVVDGLTSKRMTSYFAEKCDQKDILTHFSIDNWEYENYFKIWCHAETPVFYDFYDEKNPKENKEFYDEKNPKENKEWQKYLYVCVSHKYNGLSRFYSIKREVFIEIAKKDKLQNWIKEKEDCVYKEYKEWEKEQYRQEKLMEEIKIL